MKKDLVMWHTLNFTMWSWIPDLACNLFWVRQAYVKG